VIPPPSHTNLLPPSPHSKPDTLHFTLTTAHLLPASRARHSSSHPTLHPLSTQIPPIHTIPLDPPSHLTIHHIPRTHHQSHYSSPDPPCINWMTTPLPLADSPTPLHTNLHPPCFRPTMNPQHLASIASPHYSLVAMSIAPLPPPLHSPQTFRHHSHQSTRPPSPCPSNSRPR